MSHDRSDPPIAPGDPPSGPELRKSDPELGAEAAALPEAARAIAPDLPRIAPAVASNAPDLAIAAPEVTSSGPENGIEPPISGSTARDRPARASREGPGRASSSPGREISPADREASGRGRDRSPEHADRTGGAFSYTLLRAISDVIGLLPESFIAALGDALGALWIHVVRYRRGVILANLGRAFPTLDRRGRLRLARRATQHLMRSFLELFRIPRYVRDGLENVVELRGLHHARPLYAARNGFVAVTGHLGSFELCAGAIAQGLAPSKMHLVVKSFPPGVDRFLTELRTSTGLHLIGDRRTLPAILKALKRGEAVVFVLDQNATRRQGVFVDFFGHPASTMSALALVVRRTGVPVVGVDIWREGPGRHVLEVHPPMDTRTELTGDAALVELTQRFTRFIEDAIRRHPAQWLWTHKRWRTAPKP